jgi:hypothetical protein
VEYRTFLIKIHSFELKPSRTYQSVKRLRSIYLIALTANIAAEMLRPRKRPPVRRPA